MLVTRASKFVLKHRSEKTAGILKEEHTHTHTHILYICYIINNKKTS